MSNWVKGFLAIAFLAAIFWIIGNCVATGRSLRTTRYKKLTYWAAVGVYFLEVFLCIGPLGRLNRIFFAGIFALSWYFYREHRKNEKKGIYKDEELLPPFHHLMFTWLFFGHVLISIGMLFNWISYGSYLEGKRFWL